MNSNRGEKPSRVGAATAAGSTGTMTIEQAMALAQQHHQAGALEKAQALYLRVLQAQPEHADALHMLGVLTFQLGRGEDAVNLITRAIKLNETFPRTHFNLAHILASLGQGETAVSHYQRAIELMPNYPEAHCNLGKELRKLGRLEEAASHYQAAIQIDPDYAEPYNNLGSVLKLQGQLADAVGLYRKAIELQPEYAEAHFNLASVMHLLEDLEYAVVHYQQAISLNPELAKAHSNLGAALRTLGRMDESLQHFQRAVSLSPESCEAHNNLSVYHERMSQVDLAEESNSIALGLAPDNADSLFVQGLLQQRRGDYDRARNTLESLDADRLSENFNKRRLFELGKLYDRSQQSELAFDAFTQGNELHRHSEAALRYHKDDYLTQISSMAASLSSSWLASWSETADSGGDKSPSFIVGFPRSGTTLLDQILDSHPQVQVMEERRVFSAVEEAIRAMPGGYPAAIATLSQDDITALRRVYFQAVEKFISRDNNLHLVDKFPLNIEYVPLIHRLFPDAHFILACRHPCDVVLSNFMQYYKLNDAMANFFTLDDTVRLYQQVMDLWLQCERLLPLNTHRVKYESLVADLEPQAQAVLDFLGVGWDDSVLDFHQHALDRGIINTPSYEQVTQPVYQTATNRWRRYEEQFAPYMATLQPFVEVLGYHDESSPS